MGKTTLCRKYQENEFYVGPEGPTLGIEYHLKVLDMELNGKKYLVKVKPIPTNFLCQNHCSANFSYITETKLYKNGFT